MRVRGLSSVLFLTLRIHRHSGARHLARTRNPEVMATKIPGSCCAGPGMTETIVRVRTLATFSRGRLRGSFANYNSGFRVRDAMHDLDRAAKQVTIALKGIN